MTIGVEGPRIPDLGDLRGKKGIEKKTDPKEFLAKILEAAAASKKKTESLQNEVGKKKIDDEQRQMENNLEVFFNPILDKAPNKTKLSQFKEFLKRNALGASEKGKKDNGKFEMGGSLGGLTAGKPIEISTKDNKILEAKELKEKKTEQMLKQEVHEEKIEGGERKTGIPEHLHAHKPPKGRREEKTSSGPDELTGRKIGDELLDSGVF